MKNTAPIRKMMIDMFCELDIKIWGKISEDTINISKVQNVKIPKKYSKYKNQEK